MSGLVMIDKEMGCFKPARLHKNVLKKE